MFFHRGAKTHERFLHRAQPKDGVWFGNWLWLRGVAFTCSCSSWHWIHALCLAHSLFIPHSSLVIEASRAVASLPSPKVLGMFPVDAIFIRRKRHSKKARCASGLHYLHCVTPRACLNASSPQLVRSAISDPCMSGSVRQAGFCVGLKRVCCCSRRFFWSRCSSAVRRAAAGTPG